LLDHGVEYFDGALESPLRIPDSAHVAWGKNQPGELDIIEDRYSPIVTPKRYLHVFADIRAIRIPLKYLTTNPSRDIAVNIAVIS
jgi:hypothetical protein